MSRISPVFLQWRVILTPKVLPYRRHIQSVQELSSDEQADLAQILSEVTVRYDNLFSCSFAYSMGIHQAPISRAGAQAKKELEREYDIAHIHFHFYPPLLRSASVRKFLVGWVDDYYLLTLRMFY